MLIFRRNLLSLDIIRIFFIITAIKDYKFDNILIKFTKENIKAKFKLVKTTDMYLIYLVILPGREGTVGCLLH